MQKLSAERSRVVSEVLDVRAKLINLNDPDHEAALGDFMKSQKVESEVPVTVSNGATAYVAVEVPDNGEDRYKGEEVLGAFVFRLTGGQIDVAAIAVDGALEKSRADAALIVLGEVALEARAIVHAEPTAADELRLFDELGRRTGAEHFMLPGNIRLLPY